jgi:hypothetical protein
MALEATILALFAALAKLDKSELSGFALARESASETSKSPAVIALFMRLSAVEDVAV